MTNSTLTQVVLEVGSTLPQRVTQVVLEVGATLTQRVTQIALEVGCPISVVPATPAVPAPPRSLSRFYAAHLEPSKYAGRAAHRTSLRTTTPISGVGPAPFGVPARAARLAAGHFKPATLTKRQRPASYNYGGGIGLPTRVSMSLLEVLQTGSPSARAALYDLTVLCSGGPLTPVRAAEFSVGVLQSQNDPTFVRASHFAIEVLVPRVEIPLPSVFPQLVGLTYTYTKTPKFSTGIGVASSGREVRVSYWSKPQWEWELDYDMLGDGSPWPGTTASDLKTLIGFFLSTAGAGLPFYFQDPDDYQATGQAIGIGDGATVTFPFVRSYGLGAFVGTESVGTVNANAAVTIYVNGVAQTVFVNEALQPTGVTVNTITPCSSYMTFATAPAAGAVITASFQFLYYCRFKDDSYDFEKLAKNVWQAKKLTIFSLKN